MNVPAFGTYEADGVRLAPSEMKTCPCSQPCRTAPKAIMSTDRAPQGPLKDLNWLGFFFTENRHQSL